MKKRELTAHLNEVIDLPQQDTAVKASKLHPFRESEILNALKNAVENMQLGVTITNTAGEIIYVNPAEARMHARRAPRRPALARSQG